MFKGSKGKYATELYSHLLWFKIMKDVASNVDINKALDELLLFNNKEIALRARYKEKEKACRNSVISFITKKTARMEELLKKIHED